MTQAYIQTFAFTFTVYNSTLIHTWFHLEQCRAPFSLCSAEECLESRCQTERCAPFLAARSHSRTGSPAASCAAPPSVFASDPGNPEHRPGDLGNPARIPVRNLADHENPFPTLAPNRERRGSPGPSRADPGNLCRSLARNPERLGRNPGILVILAQPHVVTRSLPSGVLANRESSRTC